MSGDLFDGLIRANLAATAAILIVLLVRRVLQRMMGPSLSYGVWLIVPIAVACSLLPPRTLTATLPEIPVWNVTPATQQLIARATAELHPETHLTSIAIWVLGIAGALGLCAFAQVRGMRRLGALKPASGGRKVMVASSTGFGPLVIGALFPRIVTPSDFESRFAPEEQSVILAHEQAHLRRGDALVNGLTVLCQCVFWFNPFVHFAARVMRQDQELACDAAVVAERPSARKLYARAMLKAQFIDDQLPLGCYWPARSEHPLKERLAMLKAPLPGRRLRVIGATCAIMLACCAGLAAWAAQPPRVQGPKLVAGDPRLSNTGFVNLFDAKAPVRVRGVIIATEFIEPRAFFYLKDEAGKMWAVMGGSPGNVTVAERARLGPGMTVGVRGYRAWDKSCDHGCVMYGSEVTWPDGKRVFPRPAK